MNINFNDFYKSESKGFGLSTGGGTTSDSGKQSLAPSGSTTMSVKSTGEEREQITRATIGNGTITTGVQSYTKELDENGNETGKLIAVDGKTLDNNDPTIAGLNRDVNNSQEITKDMITGALDGSMTVDNRVLTSKGRFQIANDFKNFGGNTKMAIKGASSTIDMAFEAVYENIPGFGENTSSLRQIVGIISAPFSLLGETGSYLKDKEGVVNQEDLSNLKYTNYIVLGQSSGESGAEKIVEDDASVVARVNPTDGAIGDTIKSAGIKILNLFGLGDMVTMNTIVANDLTQRKDIYSTNEFHSQGTIIGVGAMNILSQQGIQLSYTQTMNAMGPAVYESSWENAVSSVSQTVWTSSTSDLNNLDAQLQTQSSYSWNEKDGVRQVTAPNNPIEPVVGIWNLIFNIKEHGIDRYKK